MTVAKRVDVGGGVELSVLVDEDDVDSGTGTTPFLLVHGLASNARLWDGVRAELAARGHRAAAVDLRGHGQSDKPDDGYDFATVAADVIAVADALGWDRPFIAGQSWGGNVAIEVAARFPDRVSAIACVDGGFINLRVVGDWETVAKDMAPPALEGTPVATVEAWLRRRFPDWPDVGVRGMLACFEVRDDGTIAPWLRREHHLKVLRHLWEQDPEKVYPSVTAPVLLVACRGDEAQLPKKELLVAAAERGLAVCRTEWRDANHDIHAQRPAEVADLLVGAATDPGFFRG